MINIYEKRNYSTESVQRAFLRSLDSISSFDGEICRELEAEMRKCIGASFIRFTGSYSSAYRNLLNSWAVTKGEAVFVPSFAPPFFIFAVKECGAQAIMVDCEEKTWGMDANCLESAVEKCLRDGKLYPRAVIASDTFGMPFDKKAISDVCARYGLLLIEDANDALCASAQGSMAGNLGDASVLSFRAPQEVSALGGGGAISTNDPQLNKNIRLICNSGTKAFSVETGAREVVRHGEFSALDEFSAALMLERAKEKDFFKACEIRRKNAKRIIDIAREGNIKSQCSGDDISGAYPFVALRAESNEAASDFTKRFIAAGIESKVIFNKPLCRHAALKYLDCHEKSVPVGSAISVETFLLPCNEYLSEEQIEQICEMVRKICL